MSLLVYVFFFFANFTEDLQYVQNNSGFTTDEVVLLAYLMTMIVLERYIARTENRKLDTNRRDNLLH